MPGRRVLRRSTVHRVQGVSLPEVMPAVCAICGRATYCRRSCRAGAARRHRPSQRSRFRRLRDPGYLTIRRTEAGHGAWCASPGSRRPPASATTAARPVPATQAPVSQSPASRAARAAATASRCPGRRAEALRPALRPSRSTWSRASLTASSTLASASVVSSAGPAAGRRGRGQPHHVAARRGLGQPRPLGGGVGEALGGDPGAGATSTPVPRGRASRSGASSTSVTTATGTVGGGSTATHGPAGGATAPGTASTTCRRRRVAAVPVHQSRSPPPPSRPTRARDAATVTP